MVVTESISKAGVYGFKYRARNLLGYGPYSDVTYVTAATVPSTPPKPTVASADATQIFLTLGPSIDNGGVAVDSYELRMTTPSITDVGSYVKASMLMSHQLTVGADSLTVGEIYTFSFRSHNAKGYSAWSEAVSVALVDSPAVPAAPEVDRSLSERDSLYITWARVSNGPGEGGLIAGYELQIDDASGGNYETLLYGVGQPLLANFKATGLVVGATYNLRVRSYNFNGYSSWSPIASVKV